MDEQQKVPLLDFIISILNAMKVSVAPDRKSQSDFSWYDNYGERKLALHNLKYLLGQILRSWDIPESHHYISKKAHDLWMQISDPSAPESISNYWYTKKVTAKRESEDEVGFYRGAAKKPFHCRKIKESDSFAFREVFHDEHIVPIKIIIDELLKIPNPDYDTVLAVLDHLYICTMLKKENENLPTYKRSFDHEKVLHTDYAKNKIEVICLTDAKFL